MVGNVKITKSLAYQIYLSLKISSSMNSKTISIGVPYLSRDNILFLLISQV